ALNDARHIAFHTTPWSTCLAALTAPSLSRDPLTDVRWTIPELDAVRFAVLQKADSVLVHERQLDQVQDRTASLSFRAEQRSQLAQVLHVHSTAHVDDELCVLVPSDPEHLSFRKIALASSPTCADRRNVWQFRLHLELIDFWDFGSELRDDFSR